MTLQEQPRRRRRPALSCVECRRRKVKCDRNDPCLRCVANKTECHFTGPQTKRSSVGGLSDGKTAGMLVNTSTIHALALESSANGSTIVVSTNSTASPEFINTPQSIDERGIAGKESNQNTYPNFQEVLQHTGRYSKSTSALGESRFSVDGKGVSKEQQDTQNSRIILYKSRTMTASHWIGARQELGTIYNCWYKSFMASDEINEDDESKSIILRIQELNRKCKLLAKTIKMGRPSMFLSLNDLNMEPSSREVSDHMVTSYFRYFESSYRILHRPTFMAEYNQFWSQPDGAPIDLKLKILLVIATGYSMQQHESEEHVKIRATAWSWLFGAQMWLSGPVEKDRLSITGLQIYCLTILLRQNYNIGGDSLWDSAGSLIQKAMQLGLHRDPKYLPPMSFFRAEMRRRLWATILEISVQSSLDAALPPRITEHDYDTQPPSNLNDQEFLETSPSIRTHPKKVYTDTWMQHVLASSLPARLSMVQQLNGLKSDIDYEQILALSLDITRILREKNSLLTNINKTECTIFHRNLLDYMLRRFLIPLHASFAAKSRENPLFHYSLATSVDASLSLIHHEPDEEFSRLIVRGGGPYREGMICAGTTLGIEYLSQTEVRCQEGTSYSGSTSRATLKQAIEDLVSVAYERIKYQAETNTKGHLFLSMALAQADAMEQNISQEPKLLRRMEESLTQCHELLQAQIDAGLSSFSHECDIMVTDSELGLEDLGLDWGLEFSFTS